MNIHILALGAATIRRAQDAIASCEACNKDAELPFDWILDEVTGRDGSTTDYFLTEPARCPRCGSTIIEKTLVEAEGGVFSV
jgi:DNA-directed RNA polymerase subunit RPC12/RpoP